jgi:hypothetical protein
MESMTTPTDHDRVQIERQLFGDSTSQVLVSEYQTEVQRRVPELALDQAAPPDPDDFNPPTGSFVVMFVADEPAGCEALRRINERIGELGGRLTFAGSRVNRRPHG